MIQPQRASDKEAGIQSMFLDSQLRDHSMSKAQDSIEIAPSEQNDDYEDSLLKETKRLKRIRTKSMVVDLDGISDQRINIIKAAVDQRKYPSEFIKNGNPHSQLQRRAIMTKRMLQSELVVLD